MTTKNLDIIWNSYQNYLKKALVTIVLELMLHTSQNVQISCMGFPFDVFLYINGILDGIQVGLNQYKNNTRQNLRGKFYLCRNELPPYNNNYNLTKITSLVVLKSITFMSRVYYRPNYCKLEC